MRKMMNSNMNDMPLNFKDDVDVWDGLLGTQGSVDNSELIMLDCFDPMDGDISSLLDDYDPANNGTSESTYAGDFTSKCNEWDANFHTHEIPMQEEITSSGMNVKRSRTLSFGDQRIMNKRQRRGDTDVRMDTQVVDQKASLTPNGIEGLEASHPSYHASPELSSEAFNQKFEGMLSKLALSMQRSEMSRSRVLGTANHVNQSQSQAMNQSSESSSAVASASSGSSFLAAGVKQGRTHFRSYLSHFKTL